MNVWTRKAVDYYKERQEKTKWNIFANHAAFYVMMSSIPMVMLVMMALGHLIPDRIQMVVDTVVEWLPPQVTEYIPEDFLYNATTSSFTEVSLTGLFMVWSSIKGMNAIAQGLESIYGAGQKRSTIKRYFAAFLSTSAVMLLLILALVFLAFGQTILSVFEAWNSRYQDLVRLTTSIGWMVAFVLFSVVFTLMYKYLAGKRYPVRKHIPGAIFAAAGWLLYSLIYSLYLQLYNPERFILYGSLGALILLMLWVQNCMTILMLGAELNVLLLNHPFLVAADRRKNRK